MSEWFKEHDWKSCVRLKRTGGSNPLLCATQTHPLTGAFFRGAEKSLKKRRFIGGDAYAIPSLRSLRASAVRIVLFFLPLATRRREALPTCLAIFSSLPF